MQRQKLARTARAIGNTPLIRLRGPSKATGCDIYGKAEFAEPGGSGERPRCTHLLKMPRNAVTCGLAA